MIIKVDVKVADDDKLMRCGIGKERKKLNLSRKNRKRFGEGGRRRKTIDIEYRYF